MEPNDVVKVQEIVSHLKDTDGAVITILHEVQELCGYIPRSVQELIARELNISLSEIFGIITFYSRFTLKPKGKYNAFVCMGTACYVKGADKILQAIKEHLGILSGETTEDGLFSIEEARCVGACGLAPIILINEDVYGHVTTDEIPGIFAILGGSVIVLTVVGYNIWEERQTFGETQKQKNA